MHYDEEVNIQVSNPNVFYVNEQENETGVVLYLIGQLDLSMAPYFRSIVDPLVNRADQSLTLNLRDLRYIDSTGLGIFISILKTREEAGAPFYIEEVSPKIKRLLDLTGISKFLRVTEERSAEAGGTV